MADKLQGKRIAFLVAPEGVEQVELTEPWKAVESEGAKPELISPEQGEIQAFNHLDKGDTFPVDRTVGGRRAHPTTTGSCCPAASPTPTSCAWTRTPSRFVRAFFEQAKPVGVDLPRPVDARRGRRPARPHDHVVAVAEDRHPQRRRQLGRRGGRGRRGPRVLAQPGRPAGVLRQDRRGVLRGQARGPAPERRLALREHGRPRSSTSTARSSTRTTTTRSRGTARSASSGVTLPLWRDPPAHRHGRRPAGRRPRRRGLRGRARRRRARGREGALHAADRRGAAARGRARADRGPQRAAATRSCWPRRPSRTRSSTTSTCSTRASSPTAGPTRATSSSTKPEPDLVARGDREGRRRPGRDDRRLDLGLRGGQARRACRPSPCSPAASARPSCARPARPACSSRSTSFAPAGARRWADARQRPP